MDQIQEGQAPSGSVASNGLLTLQLPVGRSLRAIQLDGLVAAGTAETRANLGTQITRYDLDADGKPIIKGLSATRLHDLMNYHGSGEADGAADDGVERLSLVDRYARPMYPTGTAAVIDGESLALGTARSQAEGGGNLSIQLRIQLGTITNLARIRPKYDLADGDEEPGFVARTLVETESGWGTVLKSLVIPLRSKEILRRMHIGGYGSGVLDRAEIWVGGQLVQRIYASEFNRLVTEMGKTVQSGYRHVEFGRRGHVLDGLRLDPALGAHVDLVWSTAPDSNQFTVVYELVSSWGTF